MKLSLSLNVICLVDTGCIIPAVEDFVSKVGLITKEVEVGWPIAVITF